MRKLLIIVWMLLAASPAFGTMRYLRAGQTTADSTGASWANAYNSAIKAESVLQRGDTLWVAEGDYSVVTWNVAVSGVTPITILKATVSAHGTETGWDNGYGDGQAIFTSAGLSTWSVNTGYWIFDGQGTNTVADTTGQGIKVVSTNAANNQNTIAMPYGTAAPGCTFKHVEVQGAGYNLGVNPMGTTGLNSNGNCDSLTIQYCYFHDANACLIYLVDDPVGATIEHTFLRNCGSGHPLAHSQMVTMEGSVADHNFVFRYNTLLNMIAVGGTAYIGIGPNNPNPSSGGYDIYGNIFNGGDNVAEGPNRVISSDTGDDVSNVNIYNNTIVNMNGANSGINIDGVANVEAKNNLWYNNTNPPAFTGVTVHDKNAADTDLGELNDQLLTADPFTDLDGWDFTLSAETDPGEDQPSPFNLDRLGINRGDGDIWDRGAYDLNSGTAPAVTDVYYNPAAADTTGDGTHVDPFKLWQSVRAVLDTNTVVHIEGDFNEPLIIDKLGVTVQPLAGVVPVGNGRRAFTGFAALGGTGDTVTDSVSVSNDSNFAPPSNWTFAAADTLVHFGDEYGEMVGLFTFNLNLENFATLTSAKLRIIEGYTSNGTINISFAVPDSSAAVHPTTHAGALAVYNSVAERDSVRWDATYAYGQFDRGMTFLSPELEGLFNDVTGFDGTGTYHLVARRATGSDYRYMAASLENENLREAMLYYTYTQTGGDTGVYGRALDTPITKLWLNNTLLTRLTDGAIPDTDGEWARNAAKDSAYVKLANAEQADSLFADAYGPMILVTADSVTVAGLIIRHSNTSAVRVTGNDGLIANCLFDSSSVGGSAVGNGSQWANNIFRAIADTALAVYGTSVTNTTNAYVTGSDTDGLTTPLTLASYDPADPGQAVNGVGTDVGFGNDIGPVSVADAETPADEIKRPWTLIDIQIQNQISNEIRSW